MNDDPSLDSLSDTNRIQYIEAHIDAILEGIPHPPLQFDL